MTSMKNVTICNCSVGNITYLEVMNNVPWSCSNSRWDSRSLRSSVVFKSSGCNKSHSYKLGSKLMLIKVIFTHSFVSVGLIINRYNYNHHKSVQSPLQFRWDDVQPHQHELIKAVCLQWNP